MLYVDSSAMMKRYKDEPNSEIALKYMNDDPVVVTSRLTEIEVRRNLALGFQGEQLNELKERAKNDFDGLIVMNLDSRICEDAAVVAEETLCRSLDAVHVAAARGFGTGLRFLTFDKRQASAARQMGLDVVDVEAA